MPSFMQKPEVVNAIRLGHHKPERWFIDAVKAGGVIEVHKGDPHGGREVEWDVITPTGTKRAVRGDWIIMHENGQYSTLPHHVFVERYR